MRYWGRNLNLAQQCRNVTSKFLSFCNQHKFQPMILLLSVIISVALLLIAIFQAINQNQPNLVINFTQSKNGKFWQYFEKMILIRLDLKLSF